MGSVYRHPHDFNEETKQCENAFVHILKSLTSNQQYLVLGDFNIPDDKIGESPTTANYTNHINGIRCAQINNKPTRICASCSLVIDHAYVNTCSMFRP